MEKNLGDRDILRLRPNKANRAPPQVGGARADTVERYKVLANSPLNQQSYPGGNRIDELKNI